MPNKLYTAITFILFCLLLSCKTYKPVAYVSSGRPDVDYVNTYKDIAIKEMKRTGVPASITLAQGMIESNYGRSTLSRTANNHFGIKCHNGWTGASVRQDDDSKNECFRKYSSASESFEDHSDFLKTGSRYSFLFELPPTDYKSWARGLKKAGYATNPDYADMLIRKIEENNLMIFDTDAVAGKKKSQEKIQDQKSVYAGDVAGNVAMASSGNEVPARIPRIQEKNRIQYIIVKDGETRETIEREFSLLKWELPRYNELSEDFQVTPGQILYLQPKRDKAEPGVNTYKSVKDDTMYLISQKFGIKTKSLYELNRMEPGKEPEPGTTIWLRAMKPVN
ncbi:MAG TPA: glucosaminidase domain-containing protein [Bacteroidales bacterium]|nr:glucosaminidase domain-containing protein [Bacteroidales bacterium]